LNLKIIIYRAAFYSENPIVKCNCGSNLDLRCLHHSSRQGCASRVPNLPSSAVYLTIQLLSAEISNMKWYLRPYGRLGQG